MEDDDKEGDYAVVVVVHVRGFGKKAHQDVTYRRIVREMRRQFGRECVKVDIVHRLTNEEVGKLYDD